MQRVDANGSATATAALQSRLTSLSRSVDRWLRATVVGRIDAPAERFGQMIEYHLGWRGPDLKTLSEPAPSGKRLRAGLALLVCEAVCGSVEPARGAAVSLELLHNFSLVHDDIQDASHLRRHRPTVWSLWGVEQGINAGDALFSLAQLALLDRPSGRAATMVAALNRACLRLVEGQFLDIELQRGTIPMAIESYEAMIARKTAALFECAARLGATAGEADQDLVGHFARYGYELGMAFQEQDDVLGVWGSAAETGKPDAADVVVRKRGLPAVLALSAPDAPEWLRAAYADQDGEMTAEEVRRVIRYFEDRGLRAETERRAAEHLRAAAEALGETGIQGESYRLLAAMTRLLGDRRS